MKRVNLIFVDIDGVLNSPYFRSLAPFYTWNQFDPKTVKILNRLIRENDAMVVVTSDWTKEHGIEVIRQTFKRNKVDTKNVTAISPKSKTKENGILSTVKRIAFPKTKVKYVVFDREPLKIKNIVQTDLNWGLDYLSYKKATEIFQRHG